MGGCLVIVLLLFMIPALIVILLLLAGTIIASVAGLLISTVLLIIGGATGLFKKYCNSEVKWQRIVAKLIKVILIIGLILSIIGLGVSGYFINQFF